MRLWISGPRLSGGLRPGISFSDRELKAFLGRRGKIVKVVLVTVGAIVFGAAVVAKL
jgi:hypothetical protein